PGTSTEAVFKELKYVEGQIKIADSLLAKEYNEPLFIETYNIQTGSSFSGNESGEHAGLIRVFLRTLDDSKVSSEVVKQAIARQITDVPNAYKFAIGASSRFGAPVSISLFSRDNDVLLAACEDLKTELSTMASLYNVMDNNQLGAREVYLKLKPIAYSLGLTPQSIMTQVRSAFYGTLVQRIQEGRNEIWFYVRYPESNSQNIGDLESLRIRTTSGEYPLQELCEFGMARGVTKINHFNGRKEIRVEAFMLDPNDSVLPILEDVSQNVMPGLLEKYPGLSYMHQGQVKDSSESMDNITIMFCIAFAVMMLILIIYFRSFLQGILIIAIVPLSFMAAIWGHLIEGVILSMMSIWGMVALSGTIINNAVVFMSRYNGLLVSGMTVVDALIETGRSRFRPIVLTSITTIMGLFPLIKETSSDATFVKPMAISLGYGILIGTIFILALFPALVKCANTFSLYKARLFGDKNATPESVENAVIDAKIEKIVSRDLEEAFDNDVK
ncbi:MAG: efflux RND transporter permease subunit, partial [Rikenellaceae bacterium]